MALSSFSTSNYLRRLSQVYDTYPFFFSAWVYATATNNDDFILTAGTSGNAADHFWQLLCSATNDTMRARARSTTSNNSLTTVMSHDVWTHIAGKFISNTTVGFVLNGSAVGDNVVAALTINASDSIYIGVNPAANGNVWANGHIAECSIWGGSMTTGNMNSLASKLFNGGAGGAGGNPLNITAESAQPWSGQLKAYWIDSANTITDLSGNGNDLTMVGTVTDAGTHPTIEAVGGTSVVTPGLILRLRQQRER